MRAMVNGEERTLEDGLTLAGLLELLGTPKNGIAVARNDRVVSRSSQHHERIEDGDRIEIILAVSGG